MVKCKRFQQQDHRKQPSIDLSDRELNQYLTWLEDKSYHERRCILRQQVRPRLPRFRYKFRSINTIDADSVSRLREILVDSKLWLASPESFNDPFDMSAKIIVNGTIEEKRTRIKGILKENGYRNSQIKKLLPKYIQNMNKSDFNTFVNKTHKDTVSRTGVLSFAGDPRNILMWSHYSDNHQGVCLQFEVARDIITIGSASPVEYSSQYPTANWVRDYEKDLQKVLLRKYDGWAYEKESRIIKLEEANSYFKFAPQSLTGVIFGCHVSSSTIEIVLDLLKERSTLGLPKPTLYQAIKSQTQYKISIKTFASWL